MKRFIHFIGHKLSGKMVLGLFILTNAVYVFMLTVTIPKTMEFAGGMKLLDMMPTGYDVSYVNELFISLGEIGRRTYLSQQIPVDMIYPLLFGISYCLLMAYFLKKIHKLKVPFLYLCLLPVIAGLADYSENIGIISMLINYPDLNQMTIKTTNLFSLFKSISTSLFFIAMIFVLLVFGYKTRQSARKAPSSAQGEASANAE